MHCDGQEHGHPDICLIGLADGCPVVLDHSHEVSKLVNYSKNNTPEVIKPLTKTGLGKFM